ncbi:carbamoyltransferase HypF [Steroidobacter sp. S1-65]|uniref:Carbamoyltransferase HypF n=1 Tax=Steroidobacter gossypii TaxID=2805490 RepID=A0ABS1WVH5_9GAMM|nr:carbamoyltransferase HypF [Steroidobacter gossypii]
MPSHAITPIGLEIRVRGRVQGVGFRPTVWRLARDLGLCGEVQNDAEGVLIRVSGAREAISSFLERLERAAPPLARIERIEPQPIEPLLTDDFIIAESHEGVVRTQIAPDAAVCADCARETLNPFERRYRYPFTNCTHCGPRLSIVHGIPYDRTATTMSSFALCDSCAAEYRNPADRRFHAEAIACHRCGPRVKLLRLDGGIDSFERHSMLDEVDALCSLMHKGHIVALKGLGGYQLACDATQSPAVSRLRELKRRGAKPFALMARDLDVIRKYCDPTTEEIRHLSSAEAAIVLMRAAGPERLPDAVSPGLSTLGFMLPTTPLHLLVLRRMERPVVMTSGNLGEQPQIIDDAAALERLAGIAEYALVHDRNIATRVDDSVLRVTARGAQFLRRARGFAPAPIALPPGFESTRNILAMGGDLKSTVCLLQDGQAILSHHIGNLDNAATFDDYRHTLGRYAELFDHVPDALAADLHPEYRSSKLARERADSTGLPLFEVQHHHAHVAACLVDNARALAAPPVLGIVLDGLGWGADDTLWGGEFLLADYSIAQRLGTLKPVALLGGDQAAREPWRNLYAHLRAQMGWGELAMNFSELPLYEFLDRQPRSILDAMLKNAINAPLASSCGRLFDAVAAALDLCRERQSYEGEAACRLESLVDDRTLREESDDLAYPFTFPTLAGTGLPYIEPLAMWRAVLGDLILETPAPVIAARFHKGLARALAAMATKLARRDSQRPLFDTVALSGGCFQNVVLFEQTAHRLEAAGFTVLSHRLSPANDGGLALGQAAIAAARLLADDHERGQH